MSLQIINIYHKEYPIDIKNQGRQSFQKIPIQLYQNNNGSSSTCEPKPKRHIGLNAQAFFLASTSQITHTKLALNLKNQSFHDCKCVILPSIPNVQFIHAPLLRAKSIKCSKGMRPQWCYEMIKKAPVVLFHFRDNFSDKEAASWHFWVASLTFQQHWLSVVLFMDIFKPLSTLGPKASYLEELKLITNGNKKLLLSQWELMGALLLQRL